MKMALVPPPLTQDMSQEMAQDVNDSVLPQPTSIYLSLHSIFAFPYLLPLLRQEECSVFLVELSQTA